MSDTDRDQIALLSERYGEPIYRKGHLSAGDFGPVNGKRKAEVALVVMRENGKILLQTKDFYPEGVYRIPTGGIEENEDIPSALQRETTEETNLKVGIRRFLALIDYSFADSGKTFRTYVFLLEEQGHSTLKANDHKEQISGWREINPSKLDSVAESLSNIKEDKYRNWGLFRAIAHRASADAPKQ